MPNFKDLGKSYYLEGVDDVYTDQRKKYVKKKNFFLEKNL